MIRPERARVTLSAAVVVLRAERTGLYALAAHADRSLRTLAARRCAVDAHDAIQRVILRTSTKMLHADHVSDAFVGRRAWSRLSRRQYAIAFGGRRAVITVPPIAPAEQLAFAIARAEIKVLLGDTPDFVAHLQMLAERELQRLFARAA